MKPTRDEYKIISEHLVSLIDWNKIYDDTLESSKKLFGKDEIIHHIKKMILKYPDSFDTSRKRLEVGTSVFKIHYGILNDYIYIISNDIYNYRTNGWFLKEEKLLNTFKIHKNNGFYCVYFNYKTYLRINKIEKIKEKIV